MLLQKNIIIKKEENANKKNVLLWNLIFHKSIVKHDKNVFFVCEPTLSKWSTVNDSLF